MTNGPAPIDSGRASTRRWEISKRGGRGGFTLLGVGPWLLAWFILAGLPASGPSAAGGSAAGLEVAYPDEFPLFPTMGNEGASGMAHLRQPWSPFGVSVDEEGRAQYDLTIEVTGLPEVEGDTYRVWMTTPTLSPIVHLGAIHATGHIVGTTYSHQLMVVVSRERADRVVAAGERWHGPIVLRGFSAGARVTPLAQHSLFRSTPM